jgi:type VI protein secretion system component Hcp
MKKLDKILCILLLACLCSSKSKAQLSIYLTVAGINGDVTTPAAYANSIAITAYSAGLTNPTTTSTGVQKAIPGSLSFNMLQSSASIPLMALLLKGAHASTAEIDFVNSGCSCPAYKIKVTEALISSFSEGVPNADNVISETMTMTFTTIQYTYYKPNSTTIANTFGWNFTTNSAL